MAETTQSGRSRGGKTDTSFQGLLIIDWSSKHCTVVRAGPVKAVVTSNRIKHLVLAMGQAATVVFKAANAFLTSID